MHEIFVSYSRRDQATAQALAVALSAIGLSVWIDKSDIREGDAYDTQIEDAIAQTRVVIVLWSQHSVKSHWVRAEAAYALAKHKLLPVAIEQCELPLQFLHIHTFDFDGWAGSTESESFARLVATLGKRLDQGVAAAEPGAITRIATHAETQKPAAPGNWLARTYAAAMVMAGLRFPERVIENEFQDYFRERNYPIAQFGILLGLVAYVVYGVSDLSSDAAIYSTRFRYMLVCPLLLAFYGLSYKKFARDHASGFIAAFAIVLSVSVAVSVILLGYETPFQIQTGNGTMNFMMILGLLALLPLRVIHIAWIGAMMMAMHAAIMLKVHMALDTSWLNYLHVNSMWTLACCTAFWREHQQRASFAAELT
jgi:hypothetical protein